MNVLLIHQAFVSGREAGGTRHDEFGLRLAERGDLPKVIAGRVSRGGPRMRQARRPAAASGGTGRPAPDP